MIARVRAGYGVALLVAPDPLLRLVTGRRPTTERRAVIRVLAARELTQALLMASQPDPACVLLSTEVDLVHSVSMLGWAAFGNSRRLALTSGAVAACFAAGGVARARRPLVAKHPIPAGGQLAKLIELRNLVAKSVAAYTVPRVARTWLQGTAGDDGRRFHNGERKSCTTPHQRSLS